MEFPGKQRQTTVLRGRQTSGRSTVISLFMLRWTLQLERWKSEGRMIESLVKKYKRSDRDLDALTYVVIAFLLVFAGRAAILIYGSQYRELWKLLPQVVPLLSVLVVVRVANRLISNGNIIREDDRQQELVRTTHHLIAITTDLLAKVGYATTILTEGGRPHIVLIEIAKSIEDRYETLMQRDGYRFLPGPCIDIINRISSGIFSIRVLAAGMSIATADKAAIAQMPVAPNGGRPPPPGFDGLKKDLQELLDLLFELRKSIDVPKGKP